VTSRFRVFFFVCFLTRPHRSGISLFIITFFTLVAFSCALGAIVVVELGLRMFLYFYKMDAKIDSLYSLVSIIATVLTATFFISIPLTVAVVITYLFARFLLHLRSSGREGAGHWVDETRQHFLRSKSPARTPRNDRGSEGSEESLFLVNNGQIEADSQRSDE
jgi:hypothetical protein